MRLILAKLSKIVLVAGLFGLGVMLDAPVTQASSGSDDNCKAYYGNVCTQWWGETSAPRSVPAVDRASRDGRCSAYYGNTCTRYYNEAPRAMPGTGNLSVNGIPLNDPMCRAYSGVVCTQYWGDDTGRIYPQVPYTTMTPSYYYGSWYYPTYYYAPWAGNNSYWGW